MASPRSVNISTSTPSLPRIPSKRGPRSTDHAASPRDDHSNNSQRFRRSHFQPDNLDKWVAAQYRFIPEVAKITVPPSWPGPTTAASQQVWDLYVIPDMFAQYATGKMRDP